MTAMATTLYTIGYQKRDLAEYIKLLRAAGINVLVDVRETPWSHKPGFSKSALAQALANVGIEYVHAKFAGNPKRLREGAPSHDVCLEWYARLLDQDGEIVSMFDQLITQLTAAGKRVCITCFERHPGDCHRSILAERWRTDVSRRVEHIAPDGCARLIA